MKPKYNINATHAAKRSLISMIGQSRFADFVRSNGGFMLANLAKILPAELSRITAGGAPIEATTATPAPAKQFIRLGAAAPATPPSKPTTAPKPATPPKTSEFVPAKPSAPPAKQGAPGAKAGAFNIFEARERTKQVFGSVPGFTPSQNEKSQWLDLEAVYRANGFSAPWSDNLSKVDRQLAKLNGPLFARRAKLIATLFQA